MEKGKIKNDKKYLSVLVVPHFSHKGKVLKYSASFARFIALSAFTLTAVIYISVTAVNAVRENRKLKEYVVTLSNTAASQQSFINEQETLIKILKDKGEEYTEIINKLADKYREMADGYITDRSGYSLSSRSDNGERRNFVSSVSDLGSILDEIEKITVLDAETITQIAQTNEKLDEFINCLPTFWPASGQITDYFGERMHPIWQSLSFHSGIDIAANYGQEIFAAGDGRVIMSKSYGQYGNTVIIDHGNGITSLYAHNSKLFVEYGQVVKKGDLIAYAGSTGLSTGPHLHFEVRINDEPVNPLDFLE